MNSILSGFSLGYLLQRLAVRITGFFYHWYWDGGLTFLRVLKILFLNLEQTLALRSTFYHIEEPLYGDYSLMGRAAGFVFRMIRMAIALVVYGVVGLLGLGLYFIWIGAPIYFLMRVFI
ncbi:MAG: hypothetical protein KGZ30_00290 [Anaplasmataceae bacterium]|nr:hypothetical protein [Anaplasmataceae bacterium]